MLASLLLVPALVGRSIDGGTDATHTALLPSGLALAIAKIVGLVLLFVRISRFDVYTMQWSSMVILLFFAEGAVRATSDPAPFATVGLAEAVFAGVYFATMLAILRPLKRQARDREASR
jgi:uncharacterized membrane protein